MTELIKNLSDKISSLTEYVSANYIEVLKLFLVEYLLGYLLQSSIAVLCIYAFNKKKMKFGTYSWLTIVFALTMVIFRKMPINFGVHTLFSLLVLIMLGVFALKANILYTTYAALTVTFSVIVFELITTIVFVFIVGKENMEAFFANPFNKAAAVIPCNIVFFIIILIIYKKKTKSSM